MDRGDSLQGDPEAADATGQHGPRHPRLSAPGVTIGDLTTWARARLPRTTFDLRGGAPSVVGPTLAQLDGLSREYPEVAARIEELRLEDLPTGGYGQPAVFGRSQAARANRRSTLVLNRAYFSRPGRLARRIHVMAANGWHPTGTSQVESIVTHEFGHHVMFWLQDEGFDPVPGIRASTADRRELSGYANTAPEEAFSEAFVAHHLGDENARNHPLTRTVVQFIERSLRSIRGRRREP